MTVEQNVNVTTPDFVYYLMRVPHYFAVYLPTQVLASSGRNFLGLQAR